MTVVDISQARAKEEIRAEKLTPEDVEVDSEAGDDEGMAANMSVPATGVPERSTDATADID